MNKVGYIYPQWQRAKINLSEALNLSMEQERVLNEWFRSHVFEIGQSYKEDLETVSRYNGNLDYLEHRDRKIFSEIGQHIWKGNLFMRSEYPSINHGKETVTRILIFGSPNFVGPGTREAKNDLKSK